MLKSLVTALFIVSSLALSAQAETETIQTTDDVSSNAMDELNPFASDIEQTLEKMDEVYEQETGLSPFVQNLFLPFAGGCYRSSCPVWIQVVKSEQRAYLFLNGAHSATWSVSTGAPGYGTPNFDTHPNGRIYDSYTSSKYPGGDYNGLGNMPYAVFISGGFAVHGTGKGNWSKLGQRASHGCIRMHPDNALYFNRLVRQQGINNVWITVQ